ncbi:hypothetical protein BTJ68_09481 [Hortaea werneckii EXF-2000]|uniref:Uncharacterized protein n=1 Tax=Hortaea werneckii EXF-2000 TaxID=1157616 RepID=A0A1Z5SZJ1_HORWE|nr:hypothetical protein BTJ68_09481 [Hortaea werneckii EXF-2000]
MYLRSRGPSPMQRARDCILLVDGARVNVADLVGNGLDGFVIRQGHNILKIPKLYHLTQCS